MSRRRGIFLSLVIICTIGAITVHITNEPKNVFEEMYVAEMYAAKYKQWTPLSHTEYFNEAIGAYTEYQSKKVKSSTFTETPKDTSPYKLEAEDKTLRDTKSLFCVPFDKSCGIRQKRIRIDSTFLYRDVKIEIQYQYILFSDGDYKDADYNASKEQGLYIYFSGIVGENRLGDTKDFSTYGIQEGELRERIEEDLSNILNYWVDNYADTKFKHDDFGAYEVVEWK